jgi:hypothetical protein
MVLALPFDAAFESESYEEAYGDGQDMKQEIAPAMNGFMRGCTLSTDGTWSAGLTED